NGKYQYAAIMPQGSYTILIQDPVSGLENQVNVYLQQGQNMVQDLRLLGQGTVKVTVVDGAGQPVNQAYVTLTESNFPNSTFQGTIDASNLGVASFPNVFGGPLGVQAFDPNGRGGRTSATLPQGTSSINVTVQLTTTGTVSGHFYMPDGVTPIPYGNVTLTA